MPWPPRGPAADVEAWLEGRRCAWPTVRGLEDVVHDADRRSRTRYGPYGSDGRCTFDTATTAPGATSM